MRAGTASESGRLGRTAGRRAVATRPWWLLSAAWGIFAACLAVGAIVAAVVGVPLSALVRDPVTVISEDACTGTGCVVAGAISNVVVAAWLLTGWVCLRAGGRQTHPGWRRMLRRAGVLSIALALDDLLMIHERWLPALIPHGQILLLSVYAAASAAFVVTCRRELLETHFEVLCIALALLSASVAVDRFVIDAYLLEDALKGFGVAAWAAYFLGTARGLTGSLRPGSLGPPAPSTTSAERTTS